ncbi:hypothetical protein [Bradyrhizobium monzae]|uniref:hypothetical protein n=1 Tax=Bradyrhizobium sp. Oc8 TaxID=2876780 RepID=UPI001F3EC1C2|nr:hypothetical protein [Bradyrhizobium sp. Oc8]
MQESVKARIQTDAKIYIHNDLSQGATYFHEVIEEKLKKGDREGIGFDGMACALMIAFAFEANLNFMGNKLFQNGKLTSWDEMAKLSKKRDKVFKAIGIAVEEDKRPLSSMMRMKKLRDTLAHGKPAEFKTEEEKEGTREELTKGSVLAADWQGEIKPEVVAECLSDLDDLWKQMVKASGIPVIETITQGEKTVSFKEVVQKR